MLKVATTIYVNHSSHPRVIDPGLIQYNGPGGFSSGAADLCFEQWG